MPAGVIAAIGAVATVAGTVRQVQLGKKQANLQRDQQALATRKSRRQAIRQAQITRSQAIASSQAGGTGTSSGNAGGIGSLTSQLGSELGFSSQMSGLSHQIGNLQSQISTAGAITGLGGSLFNFGMSGGSLFPKQTATSPAAAGGNIVSGFSAPSPVRPRSRPSKVPPYYPPGYAGAF